MAAGNMSLVGAEETLDLHPSLALPLDLLSPVIESVLGYPFLSVHTFLERNQLGLPKGFRTYF